jgi:transposase
MGTNKQRRHRSWPESLKREIVAATLLPGSLVSRVARRYEVNANQVFAWRQRYQDGAAEDSVRDPHAGDFYVFRGKRGDPIRIIWHDGIGMSLYAKRLEHGRGQQPACAAVVCGCASWAKTSPRRWR